MNYKKKLGMISLTIRLSFLVSLAKLRSWQIDQPSRPLAVPEGLSAIKTPSSRLDPVAKETWMSQEYLNAYPPVN